MELVFGKAWDVVYEYYASKSGIVPARVHSLSVHEIRYFTDQLGELALYVEPSWVGYATAYYTQFSGLPPESTLKAHVDAYYAASTSPWSAQLKDDAYYLLGLYGGGGTLYPSTTLYPATTLYPGV